MRQAIMVKPGKIDYRDIPTPTPGPGEILLRIKYIGICGSDVHVYHGKHPFTPYPVVQGHEYCGIVEAVGDGVEGIELGVLATARPQLVCGECGPCKRGDYNICEKLRVQGFQAPGCAQDMFVVPKERIVPLRANLTPEQGALVEPASVGCHCTARAGNLEGKNVVVVGAGTIGNLISQVALGRGAKNLLLVDLSTYRLDVARQCSIRNTSNASEEKLSEAVKRVFGAGGFQIGIEAAGSQSALSGLVQEVEKGGTLIMVGVFEEPPRIDMSVVCEHEISVIGSMMYKHEDYLRAVELIAAGKIKTEPLISKHFPFEHYLDAYKYIDAQGEKSMKVMIDL
jgi:L-iditol 2-dehydrogenase/threonine 3-dehydrogenase